MILSQDDFESIRAVIDISLDAERLPDQVLLDTPFMDLADIEIKVSIPDAESKTGTDRTRVQLAAIYWTAALITPSMPQILRRTTGRDFSVEFAEVDWDDKATDLLQKARTQIESILRPTETAPFRPTLFTTAAGRRGV